MQRYLTPSCRPTTLPNRNSPITLQLSILKPSYISRIRLRAATSVPGMFIAHAYSRRPRLMLEIPGYAYRYLEAGSGDTYKLSSGHPRSARQQTISRGVVRPV